MNNKIDELYFKTRKIEDYVDKNEARKTIDYNCFMLVNIVEDLFKKLLKIFKQTNE